MSSREFKGRFQSSVAVLMEQFVQEKQACGYRYGEEARLLARFDRSMRRSAIAARATPLDQPEVARQTTPRECVNTPAAHRDCSSVRDIHVPAGLSRRCAGAIAGGKAHWQFLTTHPDTRRGSAAAPRGRSAHAECAHAAAPPHHARSIPTA